MLNVLGEDTNPKLLSNALIINQSMNVAFCTAISVISLPKNGGLDFCEGIALMTHWVKSLPIGGMQSVDVTFSDGLRLFGAE